MGAAHKLRPRGRQFLRLVDGYTLRKEARSLLSEDNENPEYDRAIVELTAYALGGTADDLVDMGCQLGLTEEYVRGLYATPIAKGK